MLILKDIGRNCTRGNAGEPIIPFSEPVFNDLFDGSNLNY